MKKILLLTVLLSAVSFGEILEGTSESYGGTMKVSVTMDGDKISKVEVTENSDTRAYFRKASALLSKLEGKTSTEGLDIIAGATYSSEGILDAVKDALKK
ncbi:MAG: FMN-binding protein [Fusobacteriaceae bacterium]